MFGIPAQGANYAPCNHGNVRLDLEKFQSLEKGSRSDLELSDQSFELLGKASQVVTGLSGLCGAG